MQGEDDRLCWCSEKIDAPFGEADVRDAPIGDGVLCMSAASNDVYLLKDHGMDAEHTHSTHLFHTAQHVLHSEAFREMTVNTVGYHAEDGGQNGLHEHRIYFPWGIGAEILEKKQDGEQRNRQQESERHSICPFE